MSYAGRYRLEGDEIIHIVEMALTPDVVGLEQRRTIQLDGDTLTLSYTIEGAEVPTDAPSPGPGRRHRERLVRHTP